MRGLFVCVDTGTQVVHPMANLIYGSEGEPTGDPVGGGPM